MKSINNDIRERAFHWLNFVDLSEKKNHPAASLSYGQQKLLAIARLFWQRQKSSRCDWGESDLPGGT